MWFHKFVIFQITYVHPTLSTEKRSTRGKSESKSEKSRHSATATYDSVRSEEEEDEEEDDHEEDEYDEEDEDEDEDESPPPPNRRVVNMALVQPMKPNPQPRQSLLTQDMNVITYEVSLQLGT